MQKFIAVVAVLVLGVAAFGQPKVDPKQAAKVAALEKQIADAEAKLAAMKVELAKLKPAPILNPLPWGQMNVGDVGSFTRDFGLLPQLERIVDEETMLVRMTKPRDQPVVMVKYPTKGLAEDRFFNEDKDFPGAWKVTKTEKYQGKTYYVLEAVK